MAKDRYLQLRVYEETRRKLDDLRRRETDVPSASEMIRRLIDRASARASEAA
jgi:hypothetical protein